MNRKPIGLVIVGLTAFTVWIVGGNATVQEQADFLADAGRAPNRDATCLVRLDPDFALDAGVGVYQRLLFPISLLVTSDGGRDVHMPPMPNQRVRDAIEIVDLGDCTLAASTAPIAALWGAQKPFVPAAVKPFCRAKWDAGLLCVLLDGGTYGDRNITPCSWRATPSTCERVAGAGTYFERSADGGDPSEDL
jgi:hypothetical protein